jgi:hypothetical protein
MSQFAKCHSEKPKAPKNLGFLYTETEYAKPEILLFAQDDRHSFNYNIVSQAGIQSFQTAQPDWTPVFTGVTKQMSNIYG